MKKIKNKWVTKNINTRLYQIPVPIIGLTGGIGTGKSTVAKILRQKDIPVIDADQLVKNIYQKDKTRQLIAKHFPDAIQDQIILFPRLREIVFLDPAAKTLIENFIYADLPDEFKKAYLTFNNPSFIMYDVPLLFEKKLNELVDLSVCVYAPKEIQIERIITRDQTNANLAAKIIDNQMDIEKKKACADLIIANTGTVEDLQIIVEHFLEEIIEIKK